jgi:hypothetical protein
LHKKEFKVSNGIRIMHYPSEGVPLKSYTASLKGCIHILSEVAKYAGVAPNWWRSKADGDTLHLDLNGVAQELVSEAMGVALQDWLAWATDMCYEPRLKWGSATVAASKSALGYVKGMDERRIRLSAFGHSVELTSEHALHSKLILKDRLEQIKAREWTSVPSASFCFYKVDFREGYGSDSGLFAAPEAAGAMHTTWVSHTLKQEAVAAFVEGDQQPIKVKGLVGNSREGKPPVFFVEELLGDETAQE